MAFVWIYKRNDDNKLIKWASLHFAELTSVDLENTDVFLQTSSVNLTYKVENDTNVIGNLYMYQNASELNNMVSVVNDAKARSTSLKKSIAPTSYACFDYSSGFRFSSIAGLEEGENYFYLSNGTEILINVSTSEQFYDAEQMVPKRKLISYSITIENIYLKFSFNDSIDTFYSALTPNLITQQTDSPIYFALAYPLNASGYGKYGFVRHYTTDYYDYTDENTNIYTLTDNNRIDVSSVFDLLFCEKLTGNYEKDLESDSIINDLTPDDPDYKPPFEDDADDTPIGGGGDYNLIDDKISIPSVPSISVFGTKLLTAYRMSNSQLSSFASFLWSNDFFDNFLKVLQNPFDVIVSLQAVPFNIPIGSEIPIKIGNVESNVLGGYVASQYYQLDMGTLNVSECWGSFLDYSGFTTASIYLPFIGEKDLNIDSFMGGSVHVAYNIDILSGACVAFVECSNTDKFKNSHVQISQFNGNCNQSIPLTGAVYSDMINGLLSLPIGALQGASGNYGGLIEDTLKTAIGSQKPNLSKCGNMSANLGWLGIKTPILFIKRPTQALPNNFKSYKGYKSNIYTKIGNCIGFTSFDSVQLENIKCTEEEKAEIERLLKNGIYC